ncbi:hypothetical protein B9Z55_000643 [Caenorhabditis nigoni]|uniref:F-box domain-containing protein n=2 Tax=Caenorhabditis nigoni TaxID=1611254 RepID=A0A2G5VU60_9PELO|nr:hypothetical protein B9Z55_000643 [Caenorhabditis nigoni]
MKLSKYPHVVQKEILDNLEYPELFLLSFVSKNMITLIKSSQVQRFKSINYISYDCCLNNQLIVKISSEHNEHENLVKIVEREETDNDYFPLNVSGKMIDFQLSRKCKFPVAAYHLYEKESVIQSIHNYFIHLFGDSMEYRWKTDDCKTPIPQLQNLSACITVFISPIHGDMKTLENVFSSISVLKSVDIFAQFPTEPFSTESKIYKAEYIRTNQLNHNVPEVLRYFQGRQAFLSFGLFEISDLIEFVNSWKSGEAFQKLEYLEIGLYSSVFPLHQVLSGIKAKYIAPTKKPPTHTLPKVYIANDNKENTDPIISHTYVVRESDGHVASVLIREKKLFFGVWDMREEKFLRMLE